MNIKVIEFGCGSYFNDAASDAKHQAVAEGLVIEFDFNGVTVRINSKSDLRGCYRDYGRAHHIGPIIGPDFPEPDAATLEKEAEVDAARRAQMELEYAAQREKDRKKKVETLRDAPVLQVTDRKAWDDWHANNRDGYGDAIFRTADNWGRAMQKHLNEHEAISQKQAEQLLRDVDDEGITGFMFSAAKSMLQQLWIHGDLLTKVYEEDYGSEKLFFYRRWPNGQHSHFTFTKR